MKQLLQRASRIVLTTAGIAFGASVVSAQTNDVPTEPAGPTAKVTQLKLDHLPKEIRERARKAIEEHKRDPNAYEKRQRGGNIGTWGNVPPDALSRIPFRQMRPNTPIKKLTPEQQAKIAFKRSCISYGNILRTLDQQHFSGKTDAKHSDLANAALQRMARELIPILIKKELMESKDVVIENAILKVDDQENVTLIDNKTKEPLTVDEVNERQVLSLTVKGEKVTFEPASESLNKRHKQERGNYRYYEVQCSHLEPYIEKLKKLTGISETELFQHAMNGPISETRDIRTAYLLPKETKDFREKTRGGFPGGIGSEIAKDPRGIFVIRPIPGGPSTGLLREGDIITHIDGKETKDMTTEKAVGLLKGVAGTKVRLGLYQGSDRSPFETTITRGAVTVSPLEIEYLQDKKGQIHGAKIQIKTFSHNQHILNYMVNLQQQIQQLRSQGHPVDHFIFDLKNNPGGAFEAAKAISTIVINSNLGMDKVIVSEGKTPTESIITMNDVYKEMPILKPPLAGTKIVLLQNGGSASAAEIVAAALKNHLPEDRFTIIGNLSHGKNSVQEVRPLGQRGEYGSIKATTGFFGDGKTTAQGIGIQPDIRVDYGDKRDELRKYVASKSSSRKIIRPTEEYLRKDPEPAQICSLKKKFQGELSPETRKLIPEHYQNALIKNRYRPDPKTGEMKQINYLDADTACAIKSFFKWPVPDVVDVKPNPAVKKATVSKPKP